MYNTDMDDSVAMARGKGKGIGEQVEVCREGKMATERDFVGAMGARCSVQVLLSCTLEACVVS